MVRTGNEKRWEDALRFEGKGLMETVLAELAGYFNISEEEAKHHCEMAELESKREWESASRRTDDEVLSFYDRTQSYIFEHMWWHAVDPWPATNVAVADYGLAHKKRVYLDFGSGVGGNGILFARHGFDVTLADVSKTMLDFARWRMDRRGLKAKYIYLRQEELPRNQFDLVTAIDVMEHLIKPSREFRRLRQSMTVGGTLVFNCLTGQDPEKPMHIVYSSYDLYRGMRGAGLRRAGSEDEMLTPFGLEVVKRGSQSPLSDLLCALYDRYKYSRAADMYWAMKQRFVSLAR